MKKPWLSLWLSAANRSAGAARGLWTAEMRRQQNAMVNKAGRSMARERPAAAKKWASPKRGKLTGR